MVRLPFTRSGMATRLSTRPPKVARFSEPEGVLPTSAIRRCTGTDRELLRFLVLQGKVTNLSLPSPSSAPSRGRHGLTSLAGRASGEACLCVDRTSSSEGSRRRFGGRSPSSNQFRAPHSSCEHCYERRILSRVLLAPGVHPARTRGEPPLGLRFPRRPAKGGAFHEDRGAFHRRAPGRARGLLPVFIRAGLSSTQYLCPEEHRRFAD